jgi:hypothetical protein
MMVLKQLWCNKMVFTMMIMLVWTLSVLGVLAQEGGAFIPGDWRVTFHEGHAEGSCPPGLATSFSEYSNLPIQLHESDGVLSATDLSDTMGDFQFISAGEGHWSADDDGFLYDVVATNPTRLDGMLNGNAFGCIISVPFTMMYAGENDPLPPVLDDLLGQQLDKLLIHIPEDTPFQVTLCDDVVRESLDIMIAEFADGTDVFLPLPEEVAHIIQEEFGMLEPQGIDIEAHNIIMSFCASHDSNYTFSNMLGSGEPSSSPTDDIIPATGDHTALFMVRTPAQLDILKLLGAIDKSNDLQGQLPLLATLPLTIRAGEGDDSLNVDFDGEELAVLVSTGQNRFEGELIFEDQELQMILKTWSENHGSVDMMRMGEDDFSLDGHIGGTYYFDEFESFRTLDP